MLGKRSRPSVKRILDPIVPGDRSIFPDAIQSPTTPLEFKIRSPNGWKNHHDSGAVGLGIVAALEKESADGECCPKLMVVGSLSLSRSDPIPISSAKSNGRSRETNEIGGCSESYTCVISRGPNKTTCTRVYCDEGGDFSESGLVGRWRDVGMFCASPPRSNPEIPPFRTADFLSSCYLCRKMLHGKDIYMYRGEKAFCSTECRSQQIMSDEYKEKCRSETSKSSSSLLDSGRRLFSPGIVAA